MKKAAILCLLITLFLACKSLHDQKSVDDDLVEINLDFEDSTHYPWEGQYNEGNFSIMGDSNDKFGAFRLYENGDYWTSPNTGLKTARSEIQLFNTCKIDTKMSYSFDFQIPNSYVESGDWQIICQFHDQPDASAGETWANYPSHSPPVSVKYKNGGIVIAVYSWETNQIMDLVSVPIEKDTWYNLKLEIKWSLKNDGYVRAFLNGVAVMKADNKQIYYGRNCFNKASNYVKIGLYRSNDIMTYGEIYFDNVLSKRIE